MSFARPRKVERLGAKLNLLWAGLSIGVAFLATPAKFLAPSLTLPVALDVGQHTFRVYNGLELILFAAILVLGKRSKWRRRWYLSALVPGAIVLVQTFWLIPALDLRVIAIQTGRWPLPPSHLHTVYIAAEVFKVLWLLFLGLGDLFSRPTKPSMPGASRSGRGPTIQARWRE